MEPPLTELDGEIIYNPLPCFKCDKQLDPSVSGVMNQPYDGTVFTSHGQYGSTVFDPISDDRFIEITICDDCIVEAAKKRKILYCIRTHKLAEHKYSIFIPEGSNE